MAISKKLAQEEMRNSIAQQLQSQYAPTSATVGPVYPHSWPGYYLYRKSSSCPHCNPTCPHGYPADDYYGRPWITWTTSDLQSHINHNPTYTYGFTGSTVTSNK